MKIQWNELFDDIRCINLVTRDDRYESSKKIFDEIGMQVNYFRTERHPNGGAQGCFESHIKVISEAYDAGHENILIFEDDIWCDKKRINQKILKELKDFMHKMQTWDIIYLGYKPDMIDNVIKKVKGYKSIIHTKGNCTHAYIINRRMMEKMYNMKYCECEIDMLYLRNKNTYAVHPTIFFQDDSESDISGISIPGKHYLMRGINSCYYQTNIPAYVLIPCVIILILLLFLLQINILYILLIIILLFLFIIIFINTVKEEDLDDCFLLEYDSDTEEQK